MDRIGATRGIFRECRRDAKDRRPRWHLSRTAPEPERAGQPAAPFENAGRIRKITGPRGIFPEHGGPSTPRPNRRQTRFELASIGRQNGPKHPPANRFGAPCPACPGPAAAPADTPSPTGLDSNNSQPHPSTRRYSVDAAFQQPPPRILSFTRRLSLRGYRT